MKLEIIKGIPGIRPRVKLPDPEFLHLLKESGIRKLISDQYELLIRSEVRSLFPPEGPKLEEAKQRASDFFIQICGGHPYYNENRGKPMMTRRHAPFAITPGARVIWLDCYRQLLPELNLPGNVVQSFWNYLNIFSLWMVNTKEPGGMGDLRINI